MAAGVGILWVKAEPRKLAVPEEPDNSTNSPSTNSPVGREPSSTNPPPQPIPELLALGQELAAARQARGISLQELAGRVCIGPDQLQALENADASRLPEQVFVIAQARRVAEILGVDSDEAIAALRDTRGARPNLATPSNQAARPKFPASSPQRASRSNAASAAGGGGWLAWTLLSLAGLGLAAASFYAWNAWRRLPSAPTAAAPQDPAPKQPAPPAATSPGLSPTSPTAAQLVLRSKEDSWLEVRDSSGRTLFEGTLKGNKTFPLGQGLAVMAGRPDLVIVELAGQPERPLGTIDQLKWHGFAPPKVAPPQPLNPAPGAAQP